MGDGGSATRVEGGSVPTRARRRKLGQWNTRRPLLTHTPVFGVATHLKWITCNAPDTDFYSDTLQSISKYAHRTSSEQESVNFLT